MSGTHFEDHGLRAGIWHGRLTGTAPARLALVLDGQVLAETVPQADGEGWRVALPVPAEVLGQGLRVPVLLGDEGGPGDPPGPDARQVAALTIRAGAPAEGDLQTEIALLRAELDLVKQVLRRVLAQG